MGYQVVIGGSEAVPLASLTGWSDVKAWAEDLDVIAYPEIMQFTEHGLSQKLPALQDELAAILVDSPPEDDTIHSTLANLFASLSSRDPDAESAFVTDGLGSDLDDSDDEWAGGLDADEVGDDDEGN